ncbi:MAG: sugar transferase [Bacteriovoracaceae bacterium]|jgi:lipopolysaccharide/colanic/teichoic acid biosynthesis glycosyltransferase|nr:sugar transferase [Bacteriovoracaceae bacterium]
MFNENQVSFKKLDSSEFNGVGLGFESLEEAFGIDENATFHNLSVIENANFLKTEAKNLERKLSVKAGEYIQLLASTILFLLFLPIAIIIAIAMKVDNPTAPLFFTQKRVGKKGKIFKVIKFRTMYTDAEEKTGAVLSWEGDPRVTEFGRFLRKTHLDEIPQLINVLKSDMNLIGPRPERPEFTLSYNQIVYGYKYRELVKPGITGLAQIVAEYDSIAEKKIIYDLYYIRHRNSLSLLLLIALSTALKMLAIPSYEKIVKNSIRVSYL